jgi:hypothetical protein
LIPGFSITSFAPRSAQTSLLTRVVRLFVSWSGKSQKKSTAKYSFAEAGWV